MRTPPFGNMTTRTPLASSCGNCLRNSRAKSSPQAGRSGSERNSSRYLSLVKSSNAPPSNPLLSFKNAASNSVFMVENPPSFENPNVKVNYANPNDSAFKSERRCIEPRPNDGDSQATHPSTHLNGVFYG